MANNTKQNASFVPMPETFFSSAAEQKAVELLHERLGDLHFAIQDIRNAGVNIESVADIEATTRENIAKQLERDKAAYFKNMKYIPKPLKRQAEEEFAAMAGELLPFADTLQKALKNCPLPVHIKKESGAVGDYCVAFDEKEEAEYIKAAATITISPEIREFYNALQGLVTTWNELVSTAERLNIKTPTGALLKELMGAPYIATPDGQEIDTFNYQSTMALSPERMYKLIADGQL